MRLKKTQKKRGKNLDRLLSIKNFPTSLKNELINFTRRNSLISFPKQKVVVCDRCLKAHALKKAQEFNLEKDILDSILKMQEESGHHGYYMDKKRIIEI
ncbi:MAG TPA: hypothetical protein VI544_01950 [Candidatus Nanoarchaeia archaeon]|nr:hypothetical protein [Candidatus Nanoarchaeia archaeon]